MGREKGVRKMERRKTERGKMGQEKGRNTKRIRKR